MFNNPQYNSIKAVLFIGLVVVLGVFSFYHQNFFSQQGLVLGRMGSVSNIQQVPPCPPECPISSDGSGTVVSTTSGNTAPPQPYIWLWGMRTCTQQNSSCGQMEVLKSDTTGTIWNEITFWGATFTGLPNLMAPQAKGAFFNGQFWDFADSAVANSYGPRLSPDGINWTNSTVNPPWYPRQYYALGQSDPSASGIPFVYVAGGRYDGSHDKNDVWRTADGSSWQQRNGNAPWVARNESVILGFGNKIFLMGGNSSNVAPYYYNDVWVSTDGGTTWTQVTAHAPWSPRSASTGVVYNGYMWIFGGSNNSDVWKSNDGANWTQVTASAPWGTTANPCVLVFNHALWLIGGHDDYGNASSKVWSSTDGATWTQKADIGNLAIGGVPAGMCATVPFAVN